jgi:hypothetical protein
MEPDELCPPYWPLVIWRLIQRFPPPPDPDPIKHQLARLDSYFAAVSIVALASRLADKKIGNEVAGIVGKLASDPMPALTGLTAGR